MAGGPRSKARAFDVADGEHVRDAVKKHWKALTAVGATAEEFKAYEGTIALASAAGSGAADDVGLDEMRETLKDLLGDYRSSGDLVADGFDGVDPTARRELKLAGKFPNTDDKIAAYAASIAKPMKKYSAKLIKRGFTKDQQDELAEATKVFKAAIDAKPVKSGQKRKATVENRSIFVKLRNQTRYFRRLGRKALRTSDDRVDFDRVKRDRPKGKSKETPKAPAKEQPTP